MHARISINEICHLGAPLEEIAAFWREAGAGRVGMVSHTLLAQDIAMVRETLARGGHAVETITHPFMSGRQLTGRAEDIQAPRALLSRVIEAAAGVGARSIYMVTGGHGTLAWEQAAEAFAEAIAPCLSQAQQAGVALLVENASPLHADLHLAHSLRDTITLAEIAGIGVCIDLHGCWAEAGLKQSIARAGPRCGLVQVSDYVYGDRCYPCRAVPGDGAIPLERIFGWLLEAGYAGAFDLELLGPRIDSEGHAAAARRAARKVGEILEALGA